MKMRTHAVFSITVCFLLGIIGCSGGEDNSEGGGNTIQGAITGGANPVVGLFDGNVYWFVNDLSGDPDVVDEEYNGVAEPYNPVLLGTINAGTFTLEMPAGTSMATYYLIVWDDIDTDNQFTLTAENGYFAMKAFDAGTYAVEYISWVEFMGSGEYAVGYYDGTTNYIEGFSIVGTTGFNFTID